MQLRLLTFLLSINLVLAGPVPLSSPKTIDTAATPADREKAALASIEQLLTMTAMTSGMDKARVLGELRGQLEAFLLAYPTSREAAQKTQVYLGLMTANGLLQEAQAFGLKKLEAAKTLREVESAITLLVTLTTQTKAAKPVADAFDAKAGTVDDVIKLRLAMGVGEALIAGGDYAAAVKRVEGIDESKMKRPDRVQRQYLIAEACRGLARTAKGTERIAALKRGRTAFEAIAADVRQSPTDAEEYSTAFIAAAEMALQLDDRDGAVKLAEEHAKLYPNTQEGMMSRSLAERAKMLGTPAPDINATGLDGKPVALKDLAGKIVVVHFWFTQCPPCRAEMPSLIGMWNRLSGRKLGMISVSVDQPGRTEMVKKFVAERKMSWSQVYEDKGWDSAIAQAYRVTSTPCVYVLDEKGLVKRVGLRGEELEEEVKAQLDRLEGVPASPASPASPAVPASPASPATPAPR